MALEDHLGVSWYQKRFSVENLPEQHERAILTFASADFRCEVSVNGTVLGVHCGCEDPFSFDVTSFLRIGENRITARVSKPYAESVDGYTLDEVPHRNQLPAGITPGSCYNESGISGSVTLAYLPECRITDLFPEADAETGEIAVHLTVRNDRTEAADAALRLSVFRSPDGEDEDSVCTDVTLSPGENSISVTLCVPQPRLWSTEEPNLYTVSAVLACKEYLHTAEKRTGFRTFRVGDDGYFYLNGKRVFLKCSHTGNCMPESVHHISRNPELLRKDFSLAKAVGFNCIRFISGAALPLQLDLCDELGLMIYEEPVAGWLTKNGPHAAENYLYDLYSMVKRDRSHPCVTIWGLLNETPKTPPFDMLFQAARDVLPALRALDQTRLILLSSGRWDEEPDIGSVSNPYCDHWQTLWAGEGNAQPAEPELLSLYDGYPFMKAGGDVHFYPHPVPMRRTAMRLTHSFGNAYRRPVFLSEGGIGSVLDTISLVKRWEQDGITGFYPDVKMVHRMNDALTELLERLGLSRVFPFPSEFMRASMENHAFYRAQWFDLTRSDPYLCGLSLTGLLDHSICGEGLWTLFREYKPGIADVLQTGFAPLRFCLLPERTTLYPGEPLHVEAVLANEDILRIGQTYTVRAGIICGGSVRDVREFSFTVTPEDAKGLAIPVFDDVWETDGLPAGAYRFHAELVSMADAKGGDMDFRIGERPCLTANKTVFTVGMTEDENELLRSLGAVPKAMSEYDGSAPVFCGRVTEDLLPRLSGLLEDGASVIALRAVEDEDAARLLLPEKRRPSISKEGNWLYHREYLLSPESPAAAGMETGVFPAAYGLGFLPEAYFDCPEGKEPDETWAFTFSTGYPHADGFLGGYLLGKFRAGNGTLILNAYDLLDGAAVNPCAARMLVNLLNIDK